MFITLWWHHDYDITIMASLFPHSLTTKNVWPPWIISPFTYFVSKNFWKSIWLLVQWINKQYRIVPISPKVIYARVMAKFSKGYLLHGARETLVIITEF